MDAVYRHFWEGFAGASIIFAVLLVIAAIKWLKDKLAPAAAEEGRPKKVPLPFPSAMILVGGAAALFVMIAFVLYIWIVPIRSYSGEVQRRVKPIASKGSTPVSYYVLIDNEERRVFYDLWKLSKRGDHLSHPYAAPWYYYNGMVVPNNDALWSLGLWWGVCLYFFLGFSIFTLRSITSQDK